jgi:hypothetical protein
VALGAADAPGGVARIPGEPKGLEQPRAALGRRRIDADAVEAEQRVLGRNVRGLGGERLVADGDRQQLVTEAFEVREAQRVAVAGGVDARRIETLGPEAQRVLRGHAPLDRMDHAGAGATRLGQGELEERQDRPRVTALVAEVEVVDVRRVEVDGLLHEPQAQEPRVEVHVARGVAGDRSDVVQPFERHAGASSHRILLRTDACVCNNRSY